MNDWIRQERQAKMIKETYHEGDRLIVNSVDDDVYSKYEGQEVTINSVDDMGQIHCSTDNGHTLTLCSYYGDSFTKIEKSQEISNDEIEME